MKQRTAIHFILSFAVAVMLVVCGTAFQTNYSGNPQEWLTAHQRTPLLWLVDFTALYTLVLMATLARAHRRVYRQAEEIYVLREEHNNQLGAIIARASEVEEINDQQTEKLEQLEAEAQSRQEAFEEEARRLIEQMFRSLQGQVESHSRQLDAVNLALQYQRAELSELRHHLRGGAAIQENPALERLSPAEVSAITRSFPSPPVLESAEKGLPPGEGETSLNTAPSPETTPALAVIETTDNVDSEEKEAAVETQAAEAAVRLDAAERTHKLDEKDVAIFDPTLNARSTLVMDTAEFDAFSVPPPPPAFQKQASNK